MQIQDSQAILRKYKGTTIKVDSFFLKRTSFVSNQTLLKLGEYNLLCVPAYLGFEQAQFLVVLTPSEVSLFTKFISVTNTLVITFEEHESKDIARFHIRVNLIAITPLERKNVCMLTVQYKSIPSELVVVLGNYLDEMEARKTAFESLANDWIEIDGENSDVLGYNHYAELLHGDDRVKVRLVALHSKQARLVLPHALPEWEGRRPTGLRLYFKTGQFTLDGVLEPESLFSMGFSNELLNILEDFRFRQTVMHKKKTPQGSP
jgi:hypothetical protein